MYSFSICRRQTVQELRARLHLREGSSVGSYVGPCGLHNETLQMTNEYKYKLLALSRLQPLGEKADQRYAYWEGFGVTHQLVMMALEMQKSYLV